MSGLSAEDKAALASALLPHSWEYPDSFDECGAYVGSQGAYAIHLADSLTPTVEQIVAEHVTRALNEAADAIEAELTNPERRRPLAHDAKTATDFADDRQWSVQIVRNLAAKPT